MTATSLTWHRVSRDYYRTADSRFEIWYAVASRRWLAVDAVTGFVHRAATQLDCERWCERKAMEAK